MGWAETTLGELGKWSSGGTPSRGKPEYYGGAIPWVKTGELRDCRIGAAKETITEEGLANSSAKLFPKNTLLVAMYGATIGQTGVLDIPAATNQACAALLPDNGTDELLPFIFYFICSQREQLKAAGKGGAQPNISQGLLKEYGLAIPPRQEQRRIVAKIESLFERSRRAKEALDALPPLLDKLRQSILAAAFRGDLTADWRAQNPNVEPADKLLERIRTERRHRWEQTELVKMRAKGKEPKDDKWKAKYKEPDPVDASEFGELPTGWSWCRMETLTPTDAPVVYGIVQPGPHIDDGVPFVRPADIHNSTVDLAALPRTSPEIAHKYRRAAVTPGDLIYSVVGTIGKWIVVPPELDGANITQSSVRIRPIEPFDAMFYLRALQSPPVQAQVKRKMFGNAVQRLNVAHVREMVVPVPPEAEWRVLNEKLESALSATEKLYLDASKKLATLESSILAKAFRGELVEQDPSDEPASVLLERSRAAREAATPVKKKKTKRRVGGKKNTVIEA